MLMGILVLSSCVVVSAGNVSAQASEAELKRIEIFQSIANPEWEPEKRAQALVDKMTLEQKMRFLGGYQGFYTIPIPELGIRSLKLVDASMGIRANGRSTAFPGAVTYASSFNKEIAYEVGRVIAEECRAKGADILLGPGVNIQRLPTNGRNWEYMGEDPYLAGEVAAEFIKGIQDNGIIACVKHFAANNADNDRHRMNSIVDERTLHEIYFPAFKKAIYEGDVASIMMAYNPVNGISASENEYLMNDIIKTKWNFPYFIVSDWISVYNTYEPFVAGLDLEMPRGQYFNEKAFNKMVKKGQITQEELESGINDKVYRILLSAIKLGVFDRPQIDENAIEFGGEHDEIATKVAEEGIVLLKNEDNILPINREKVKEIVVMGSNAIMTPTSCGGAGWVIAHNPMNFFDSIKKAAGPNVKVRSIGSGDVVAMKNADMVIVCEGWNTISEEEYLDRHWKMWSHQVANLKRAAKYNDNVVAVINCGGAYETESWIDGVKALVNPFYLGQAGEVLGRVLFGDVNPTAKLPFTFGKDFDDYPVADNYLPKGQMLRLLPGLPLMGSKALRQIWDCNYEEGLDVGYRYFLTKNVEAQFNFGFGLSYSTYEISDVKLSSAAINADETVTVNCTVTNRGSVKGAEIVQVYVHDNESSVYRPEIELKGFTKVYLEPNETKTVSIELDADSFKFYDVNTHGWITEAGDFEIRVGNSSDNITATLPLSVM